MFSVWAAATILLSATLVVAEQPIVQVIREVIYETNTYLSKNHLDERHLPNIGLLRWDPIKLRNGQLGLFSTIQLIGEPNVEQDDLPDGSTSLAIDLTLGLEQLKVSYDFYVSLFGHHAKNGSLDLTTKTNAAQVNVTLVIKEGGKCEAALDGVEITEFEDISIQIQPDDIPDVTLINEVILNYISPKVLPAINSVLNKIIYNELFQNIFSELACKQFPM